MRKLSQLYSICYLSLHVTDFYKPPSTHGKYTLLGDSTDHYNLDTPFDEGKDDTSNIEGRNPNTFSIAEGKYDINSSNGEVKDVTPSIEEQLRQLEEEKAVYNQLRRMVRQSQDFETPTTTVSTQAMYPPADKSELERMDKSEEDGVPLSFTPYDDYKPVNPPVKSNSTTDFLPSITQMPECKDVEGVTTSFSIKDYSKPKQAPFIDYDDIRLTEVNAFRKKKGLEPLTIKLKEGESLMDNEEFSREYRELQLENYKDIRLLFKNRRQKIQELKNSYYYSLPRDDKNYAIMTENDIKKLSFEEVREELRRRGYRTGGYDETVRDRLSQALKDNDEWRYKNIVSQELTSDNPNLSEFARNKIRDIEDKIKYLDETPIADGDYEDMINRIRMRYEILEFKNDPVSYLELDKEEYTHDLTPSEIEEIRKAPVVYDTEFIKDMQRPETRLPDILQPTFKTQEEDRPIPTIYPYQVCLPIKPPE